MSFLKLKNRKFLAGIVSLLMLFIFLIPIISFAKLVTCDGADCDFNKFVEMINEIINWIIGIAGVIFTISFIYGGFLWMTSGGDSGKTGKARDILWSTLKGFVIILVSWLIVYTIIHTLVDPGQEDSILKFIK